MGSMCVRVFIEVSDHMCISIYVCTVFLKNFTLVKQIVLLCNNDVASSHICVQITLLFSRLEIVWAQDQSWPKKQKCTKHIE
jgi:hypothetical protein